MCAHWHARRHSEVSGFWACGGLVVLGLQTPLEVAAWECTKSSNRLPSIRVVQPSEREASWIFEVGADVLRWGPRAVVMELWGQHKFRTPPSRSREPHFALVRLHHRSVAWGSTRRRLRSRSGKVLARAPESSSPALLSLAMATAFLFRRPQTWSGDESGRSAGPRGYTGRGAC